MPSRDDVRTEINAQLAELREQLAAIERWTVEQDRLSARRAVERDRWRARHERRMARMERLLAEHDRILGRVYARAAAAEEGPSPALVAAARLRVKVNDRLGDPTDPAIRKLAQTKPRPFRD